MADPGVPDKAQETQGKSLRSVPPMPTVAAADLLPGQPHLVQYSNRHGIGWQRTKKDGPFFVVARTTMMNSVRVVETFPLTEAGWAKAWRALVRLDGAAARATAARLAELAAREKVLADLAQLSAASVAYLPGVILVGGYAAPSVLAMLAVGTSYDLRFLDDRLAILLPGRVDALAEMPYKEIEAVDIGGPGLVRKFSPGEQAGLALALGLPGALLGLSGTKIQTILRVNTADSELFFLNRQKQADALRIELSVPLKAIRDARVARPASSDQSEPATPESITDQLTRLASMLEAGLLTRAEFDQLKAGLIAQFSVH